jgi:hypothetical protein
MLEVHMARLLGKLPLGSIADPVRLNLRVPGKSRG